MDKQLKSRSLKMLSMVLANTTPDHCEFDDREPSARAISDGGEYSTLKDFIPTPTANSVTTLTDKPSILNDCEPTAGPTYNYKSDDGLESINDFDSDDSVFDKDYLPPTLGKPSNSAVDSDSSNCSIIPYSQGEIIIPETPEPLELLSNEQPSLTKRGTIRKRKKYDTPLAQRKKAKLLETAITKYSIKPGCTESCKKKCNTYFSYEVRNNLNHTFRKMSWKEQQYFIMNNTSKDEVKRKTVKNENRKLPRNYSISYFLVNESGTKINVCKLFFLTTLGFGKKNDKAVRNALKQKPTEIPTDMRGKHVHSKIDNTTLIAHINSFNPVISHYRREHAPNRKYLPSDLSVTKMYKDYCEQFYPEESPDADGKVSYEYYRQLIKTLNISFTRLGHEECEACEKYFIHNPNHVEIRHRNCKDCIEYEIHRHKYILAREEYKQDAEIQSQCEAPSDTAYFSADLQKVIMLPRIEEFKAVLFCPRLIAFNESFVPLGSKRLNTSSCTTFATIWHEAISGRKKDDIASCFKVFLHANRDLKNVVIWLDNCAGQNKNWCLFSYLAHAVNSLEFNFRTITLKYLESGHTFMSADEFHHQVEHSLKKMKRVYDFDDFYKAVSDTKRNITVKSMNVPDFHKFDDCSSIHKLQNTFPRAYLSNMSVVMFRRDKLVLFYKTGFDKEYIELDFLKVKNIRYGVPTPKEITQPRGITPERKSIIINRLCSLMPENRRVFWHNLPVNENENDPDLS